MAKTANKIVQFAQPVTRARLECPQCQKGTDAICECNVPYKYVTARELAERALAKSPQKSDRAIAEETGVNKNTVARARDDASNIEMRIGKDGKAYNATRQPAVNRDKKPAPESEENWQEDIVDRTKVAIDSASLSRWKEDYGKGWTEFKVTEQMVKLAEQAAKDWRKLATVLRTRLKVK